MYCVGQAWGVYSYFANEKAVSFFYFFYLFFFFFEKAVSKRIHFPTKVTQPVSRSTEVEPRV